MDQVEPPPLEIPKKLDFLTARSQLAAMFSRILSKGGLGMLLAILGPAMLMAEGGSIYNADEAAKHVNETATVRDKVENVHQSVKGHIFLNMGGHYPNQVFTAYVPSSEAASVSNARQYEGKTVSVTGKILLYRGKPEIVVTSISQIKTEH